MKGVVIDLEQKEIMVFPIPDNVIETSEWQDSIESIDNYLFECAKVPLNYWETKCTFFILEDGEALTIKNY